MVMAFAVPFPRKYNYIFSNEPWGGARGNNTNVFSVLPTRFQAGKKQFWVRLKWQFYRLIPSPIENCYPSSNVTATRVSRSLYTSRRPSVVFATYTHVFNNIYILFLHHPTYVSSVLFRSGVRRRY